MTTDVREKTGVLLINLGTPRSPEPKDVGIYLKEFLMDPYVIDIPFLFRWILIHGIIVPRRSKASALLYQKVWTKAGSPLLFHTLALAKSMQGALDKWYVVVPAMRYGNPSIAAGIGELLAQGVTKILACPLYPQYSLAATQSSIAEVERVVREKRTAVPVSWLPAFYRDEEYLAAVTEVSAPALRAKPYDMALFSFHGLPERQVKKTDPSGTHCLAKENCCDIIGENNRDCYRAQCYATAKSVAARLGISKEKYAVCFQSRLGRTPWIRPYTDEFYRTLPKQGIKRLAVLCPSFVADCLETLEEVQLRGKEEFVANGGEDLFLVPSLNAEPVWIGLLAKRIERLERESAARNDERG